MMGLTQSYITPFALTMKATTQEIGLLASIPSFCMAAAQFVAPGLSKRIGSRKGFILLMAFMHALMWLPILLVAYLFQTHQVWWLIAFMTLSTIFDSASFPAWGSMMADLVPAELRGRFFGGRGRITGLIAGVFTYFAGGILQLLTNNTAMAFTVIFAGALIARLVSVYFVSQMYEPLTPTSGKKDHDGMVKISSGLLTSNLGRFIIFCALINFSATVAGPFFAPYMLRDLKFSYISYTIMNSVAGLASISFMTWWGKRMDRAGCVKVMKITSFLIPFVPIGWAISQNYGWLIFMQVFSGFAWAGFQLASGIFIFDASPPENRTRYIAVNNALIFLGVSVGSLTGGIIAPHLPHFMGSYFISIFILSGLIRLVVVLFFIPHIKEVREVPAVSTQDILLSDFRGERFKKLCALLTGRLRR